MVKNNKDQSNSNQPDSGETSEGQGRLSRRTAVKSLGAMAAVTGLPIAATGARAAGEEYDVVTVSSGSSKTLTVSGGETLENVLIDVTADGANAKIRATGDGWTIRNIGLRGKNGGGFFMYLEGSGTCEHVYLGDGNPDGVNGGGAWIDHADSDGPFVFEEMYVAHMVNQGLYLSPTSPDLVAKTTHVRNSYFDSNNGSGFKIGSEVGTSTAENVTIRTDGRSPPDPGGNVVPRALWVLGKTTASDGFARGKLVDCDIQGEVQWQGGCEITVENTRHEGFWEHPERTEGELLSNPDLTPPAGVPMTPEEGAAGTSSSPGGSETTTPTPPESQPEFDHTIAVLTDSTVQSMDYQLGVTGEAGRTTRSEKVGASKNDQIETASDGTTLISGTTGNGYGDAFEYNGSVTGFEITNIGGGDLSGVSFEIDGQPVDTQSVVEGTVGDDSDGTDDGDGSNTPTKLLAIDGSAAPSETAKYEVRVTGTITKDADRSTVNDGGLPWDSMTDHVEDGTAIGVVGNGTDVFEFSGTVEAVTIDGDATFNIESI